MTADCPFEPPLPRLIEGLDEVRPPRLFLGRRHDPGQHASLVHGRRQGLSPHASGARPADLSYENLLMGECLRNPLPDVADMRQDIVRGNRVIFPIGQDMDGHEIDRVDKLRSLQPELPDIRIGDRFAGTLSNLADILFELGDGQFASQQRLVAHDQSFDDVWVVLGECKGQLDLVPIVGAIPAKPNALQHLQAVLAGDRGDPAVLLRGRIGPNAGRGPG